jgi:hypothetical protein
MIVFRKDQLDAFRSAADADFERVLVQRLVESFPKTRDRFGEPTLGRLVRVGLERARAVGLDQEDDILRYIGVMLLLGSDFGDDPQLRWAAAALTLPAGALPRQRVAALWEQTRAYCGRVFGADNRIHSVALRALEGKSAETLIGTASRSSRDLLLLLAAMHPQKVQEIGESAIHDLTRFAVETCRQQEMLDRESVALLTVLMFLFGSGLMTDPLTAWAPQALDRTGNLNPAQRLAKLFEASLAAASRLAV